MSAFRAMMSTTPLDRDVASHVAVAERAIHEALVRCERERRSGQHQPAYLRRVYRDLERCIAALHGVRRSRLNDDDDPVLDPVPEEPIDVPLMDPEGGV